MIQEQAIRDRIEQTLRRTWTGVVSVEQAIDAAIQTRSELPGDHRAFFDALIMQGIQPENAIQTLQYAIDQGVLTADQETVLIARAS